MTRPAHPSLDSLAETIVGGAPVSTGVLNRALMLAPRLAAADGGADTVLAAGLRPARVVGDMDSLSPTARTAFTPVLNEIAEQDSTDFAKALRTSDAPWTVGVGFLGARLDHTLACLTELARSRARCVLLGEEDCVCILPPHLTLHLPVGSRVSLWPLGRACGRSTGLHWPVDGIEMAPASRVGTSNHSDAPDITLAFDGAPVALLLAADAIEALLEGLDFRPRPPASPPL
ncbi:thiamine diphosphokinase [Jannaschia sp.]|nr:thiamine diphosphokinase [Jannaschia sp.]